MGPTYTRMGNATGRRLTELRRSNASGKHRDKRTRRLRTRAAALRRALTDQGAPRKEDQ